MSFSIKLLIHTALYFEAEIFIEEFKLKRNMAINDFLFFYNEQNNIALITSTKSSHEVAYAFGFIKALCNLHPDCKILNFGIAGSKDDELYTIKEIVKITDNNNAKSYYPLYITAPSFELANLTSFASAYDKYEIEGLYDMEAVSFFAASCKLTIRENIRIVKIISDNLTHTITKFDYKIVIQEIKARQELLISYANKLLDQQLEISNLSVDSLAGFSFSERRILLSISRNISSLDRDFKLSDYNISNFDILKTQLEDRLNQCKLSYIGDK